MKKQTFSSLLLKFVLTALTVILPCSATAQSSIQWTTAIKYGNLIKIAASVDPSSDYSTTDKENISALGYTYLTTIYGNDFTATYDPSLTDTVSYGFIGVSPAGELVTVLRGSDTILEWVDDAEFYFVVNPVSNSYGYTEEGFSSIYKSLRVGTSQSALSVRKALASYISKGTGSSVTLAGHSLGGALAELGGLDVALNTSAKPTIYTFASPKVGEYLWVYDYDDHLSSSYRVYNSSDVVPDLPLWPFEQVKTGFKLTPNTSVVSTSIACSHHLTTYIYLMGQAAGVNAGSLDSDCVAN
ncbi:lipase family protein [Telmatobacter bradus]|uniref:lipase family protein n=1 Tax=Telmatobacter bradus TaxID=474953 RepID=UPI003B43586F